jgi:Tfp pilus assembly protein PilO
MFFRERQQITIFLVAAAIVGGFVLVRYLPLQKKTRAVKDAKSAQTLAVTKSEAEGRQLPVLKEQLLKLQQAVGSYELNIPAERALGGFLQKIADLMNQHNLEEQVVAPGKEVIAGNLKCIPLDMQCKGKLSQIFEFYKQLQQLDRLVRIEQVKLENDNSFGGRVSMHTKAVIYCRAEAPKG